MGEKNELVLKLHVRPGTLMVTVQKGMNLDAKDDNGFSDPYVVLEFQKKKKKTKIIKKNLNPIFGEQFEFGFAMNSSPILHVVCMDHDRVGSDDFIGEEYIDVSHQKMEIELSIPLKPKGKGNKTNTHVFSPVAGSRSLSVSQSAPPSSFSSFSKKASLSSVSTPSSLSGGKDKKKEEDEADDDDKIYTAFRVILTDPRYIRLAKKLDPRFRSKNMLKTLVDPSNIPYVGHVVNAKRSVRGEQNRSLLKKVKDVDENGQMASTYDVLEGNMKTECATRHLTLGMGLAFQAMPVSVLLPGVGDAAAATAGGVAASGIVAALAPGMEVAGQAGVVITTTTVQAATETGVELATLAGKTVAETVLDEVVENAVEESAMAATDHHQKKKLNQEKQVDQVNATFTKTKILLLYLGYPATEDELYQRWESHRIVLKKLYGAKPEDDLAQMEGTEELKQAIKEICENPDGVFNVEELGVSPLWLLWKIYECWGTIYFDFLQEKSHVFSRKAFLEEKRARERYQDEQYLKNLCLSDYPGIRKVLKTEKELCIQMLMKSYKNHPHMEYLIASSENDTEENMYFYWENVFDYFYKEYQVWAFEDLEDLSIQAIALVEPPIAKPPNLPDWMGKRDTIRTLKHLGTTKAKALEQELKNWYDFRKQHIGQGGGIQVIHYVANCTEDLGEGTPLHQLVEIMLHTLNNTKPKYVQEYNRARKWQSFFTSCGMERREKTESEYRILWKEPDVTEEEVQAMEALRNAVKNELVLEIMPSKKKKPDSFKVKILRCNNLDALDKTGTSDPFLVLTFQGKEKKTETRKKELNPVWNKEFEFPIKKDGFHTHKKILKIKCYDDNKYSRPELIGMQKVNVLTQKPGEISIPLLKKSIVNQGKDKKNKKTFEAADNETRTSSTSSSSGWGN